MFYDQEMATVQSLTGLSKRGSLASDSIQGLNGQICCQNPFSSGKSSVPLSGCWRATAFPRVPCNLPQASTPTFVWQCVCHEQSHLTSVGWSRSCHPCSGIPLWSFFDGRRPSPVELWAAAMQRFRTGVRPSAAATPPTRPNAVCLPPRSVGVALPVGSCRCSTHNK